MAEIALDKVQRIDVKPPSLGTDKLIYPVLGFLTVFFVLPIAWFFIKSALDFDGNFAVMLYETSTSRCSSRLPGRQCGFPW